MSNYGPDYDRFLDAERERRDCEGDAYTAWCEDNDKDQDEDHWAEWQQAMDDAAEDHAERMAEEAADRMADYERYGDDY